jgi:hypothetical protein
VFGHAKRTRVFEDDSMDVRVKAGRSGGPGYSHLFSKNVYIEIHHFRVNYFMNE